MWNKIILHIFASLFSGFTFWKIGNGTFALQLHLFCIFNFVFVAPGCINQMQPFFLHNRDIFEAREKKVLAHSLTKGKNQLTLSVQNLPLGCLHRRANYFRNSLSDCLRDTLLPLCLLHGQLSKRF